MFTALKQFHILCPLFLFSSLFSSYFCDVYFVNIWVKSLLIFLCCAPFQSCTDYSVFLFWLLKLCRTLALLQQYWDALQIINRTLKLGNDVLTDENKEELRSLGARKIYLPHCSMEHHNIGSLVNILPFQRETRYSTIFMKRILDLFYAIGFIAIVVTS